MQKALFIFFMIFLTAIADSRAAGAGSYADSAHGDTAAGVLRDANHCRGNCAHCHEMHASIDGSEPSPAGGSASGFCIFADNFDPTSTSQPYSQDDNYCFYCHTSDPSSLQAGGITNYDYARTFAGDTTQTEPAGILEAFNNNSDHNLYDIQEYAKASGLTWFKDTSNPCTACHNPHIAKRNKSDPDNPLLPAISRFTETGHSQLFGDDASERLNAYTGDYQAPYYYNSTSTYEPGGTAFDDGSLTPDYNTFCLDCHDTEITRASDLSTVKAIDWAADKHGKADADKDPSLAASIPTIDVKPPYYDATDNPGDCNPYVLSCLDCHEPHGSPFPWLTRQSINGLHLADTINMGKSNSRGNHCRQCHKDDDAFGQGLVNSWQWTHHQRGESPYQKKAPCGSCHGTGSNPIPCENCHYHGATLTNCNGTVPATRKAF